MVNHFQAFSGFNVMIIPYKSSDKKQNMFGVQCEKKQLYQYAKPKTNILMKQLLIQLQGSGFFDRIPLTFHILTIFAHSAISCPWSSSGGHKKDLRFRPVLWLGHSIIFCFSFWQSQHLFFIRLVFELKSCA